MSVSYENKKGHATLTTPVGG